MSFDDKVKNKIIIIIIIIIITIIITMVNFLCSLKLRVWVPYSFLSYSYSVVPFPFVAKNCFVVCPIEQKKEEIRKKQEGVRRLLDEVARDIEITCSGK